jgi:hypothetical protein
MVDGSMCPTITLMDAEYAPPRSSRRRMFFFLILELRGSIAALLQNKSWRTNARSRQKALKVACTAPGFEEDIAAPAPSIACKAGQSLDATAHERRLPLIVSCGEFVTQLKQPTNDIRELSLGRIIYNSFPYSLREVTILHCVVRAS